MQEFGWKRQKSGNEQKGTNINTENIIKAKRHNKNVLGITKMGKCLVGEFLV
jgi:hypothetical protein